MRMEGDTTTLIQACLTCCLPGHLTNCRWLTSADSNPQISLATPTTCFSQLNWVSRSLRLRVWLGLASACTQKQLKWREDRANRYVAGVKLSSCRSASKVKVKAEAAVATYKFKNLGANQLWSHLPIHCHCHVTLVSTVNLAFNNLHTYIICFVAFYVA